MSLYRLVRPLLFSLDAETAHRAAMSAIRHGLVRGREVMDGNLAKTAFGVRFRNPVGLAAGFDKNAEALARWKDFGFGFVEIGTITQHAQPGQDRPRLFRIPEDQALINRMGFNNEGADAVAKRLETDRAGIPLGINIGKSKVTELDEAAADYAYSFRRLREFGDYFVVNVSSPNTPGLRSLQDREPLTRILAGLRDIDSQMPLFVKISPDLTLGEIEDVVAVCDEVRLTGIIATNTTLDRSLLKRDPNQAGGLSGAPLTDRSQGVIAHLRELVADRFVLIGVGGIMTPEDARARLAAGADLIQVYTGWVYGGLDFVAEICDALGHDALPASV